MRIGDLANVGNHIHLKVKFITAGPSRIFLRTVTTQIARQITGAKKGKSLDKPFWDGQAFTRVLSSWTEEVRLRGYFMANRLEAAKGPLARAKFLEEFNRWVKTIYRPKISASG